ncbi:MAG: hypothetical protein PHC66_01515 [Candidatus Nanoarchaeia archaeon]|nr:hypothetical protein [Candidatus Nanoarchaeia archaeon]MDD5239163.1 hypothetical protein [Candidatus Nanoarchaeia archaeon]
MVSRLRLESLKRYLRLTGWVTRDYTLKLLKIHKQIAEENLEMIIPNTEDILDYNSRIKDIIQSLSVIDNKEFESLYEEIANIGYDLMKIRFDATKTEEGTIPLGDFVGAINNVKTMIMYGACSEIQTKSQYRKPFDDAKFLVDNCEFAQTEFGSFVISIRVPLGKTYLVPIDEDNEYLKDLGRKTIARLIEGINEVEQVSIEDEEAFREGYDKKLNKNVCEAISHILQNEEGFNVEITAKWDNTLPLETELPNHSRIEARSLYQKFNKIASYLKKIHEPEEITITGNIKKLETQDKDLQTEKKLITIDVPSLKRKVYLYITEQEHISACNAYRDKARVQVTGTLNKKTQHWCLDNPSNLRILS